MATTDSQVPPWYRFEIGTRLKPLTRQLFETYSRIPADEVEAHLHSNRDRAWSLQHYPCIGQWTFLMTRTPSLPYYTDVVTRVKDGACILDVGCCFGQDLRYLAADGAPTQNMYASDIVPGFWDIGYDLYRDSERMEASFLDADILDSASPHIALSGKVDILLANQVFHLFDWERQVQAGKNMVLLSRPGTWIVGYQIGSELGRAAPVKITTGGAAGAAGGGSKFFHNSNTWRDLWGQIQLETGTEWIVTCSMCSLREWGWEDEDTLWMGSFARGLEFIVRRVDTTNYRL